MSNNTKYYKKQKEDDSFLDLYSLKSAKIVEEIELIDKTLIELRQNLYKYIDDSREIWDEQISGFLQSDDCNTLHYLSQNEGDKFIHFMVTQKTFKLMMISETRLNKRRKYLVNHM